MILEAYDIQFDLCAVVEHLGNHERGHYLCAKRNFIMTQPFMLESEKSESKFHYTNWCLVSDESKEY